MRKLLFLGLSVLYALAMTFCAYSPVVNNYINNRDNYIEIEAKFVNATYNDEGYSYLYINLTDFYRYHGFTGQSPEELDQSLLDGTIISIKIMPQNAKILKNRGFFDGIPEGTLINIHTTCWRYEGIDRHYLAAISVDETEYLSFDEGMRGIGAASGSLKDVDFNELFKPQE